MLPNVSLAAPAAVSSTVTPTTLVILSIRASRLSRIEFDADEPIAAILWFKFESSVVKILRSETSCFANLSRSELVFLASTANSWNEFASERPCSKATARAAISDGVALISCSPEKKRFS